MDDKTASVVAAVATSNTANTSSSESGKEALETSSIRPPFSAGTTTPPTQSRLHGPPTPRARRRIRVRRQRRRRPSQFGPSANDSDAPLVSVVRRRLQSISQDDNLPNSVDDLGAEEIAPAASSLLGLPTQSAQPGPQQQSTPQHRPGSNPAVRVLFRDQQQQQVIGARSGQFGPFGRPLTGLITGTNFHSGFAVVDACNSLMQSAPDPNSHLFSLSVAEANRRLIERQIEAMRAADSRRWNFDFGSCRPMNQPGHRYMDCSAVTRDESIAMDIGMDDNNNSNSYADINLTNNDSAQTNTGSNAPLHTTSSPLGARAPTAAVRLRNVWPLNDKNQTQNN